MAGGGGDFFFFFQGVDQEQKIMGTARAIGTAQERSQIPVVLPWDELSDSSLLWDDQNRRDLPWDELSDAGLPPGTN